MSFLKRHQTSVAVFAALALFAGAAYICSGPNCGANCPLSGLFSASTAYAGPGCSAEAKAKCAVSSTSGCPYAKTTAAVATETSIKSCGDKEACIAKCMKEKGYTRAEAEACWAKCQTEKASGKECPHMIQTAAVIETTPVPTHEACVDALVAKGMTREAAESHVAKCEKEGMTAEAAVSAASAGSGCCAHAKTVGAGCCAKRASATTTEASSGSGSSH